MTATTAAFAASDRFQLPLKIVETLSAPGQRAPAPEPTPAPLEPERIVPASGASSPDRYVRIAAIGDLHVKTEIPQALADDLQTLPERADALVIAGDISDNGRLLEFERAAEVLRTVNLPIVAVLGNHDRRCLRRAAMRRILEDAGVTLLDGDATHLPLPIVSDRSEHEPPNPAADRRGTVTVGFAGVGGYGGGFWPDEVPTVAPPLHRATQAIALRARREAMRLDAALEAIQPAADLRIVVMHYSPTTTTLGREPIVKYWMLGNIELARVIDRYPVDLVIHGHAHLGNPAGQTIGGTPVRNVANPVVGHPVIYEVAAPCARPTRAASREAPHRDGRRS